MRRNMLGLLGSIACGVLTTLSASHADTVVMQNVNGVEVATAINGLTVNGFGVFNLTFVAADPSLTWQDVVGNNPAYYQPGSQWANSIAEAINRDLLSSSVDAVGTNAINGTAAATSYYELTYFEYSNGVGAVSAANSGSLGSANWLVTSNGPCCSAYTSNLTWAVIAPPPIPLPASFILFGPAALAGLFLFRRSRTASSIST